MRTKILTEDELKSIISIIFNPVRVGFHFNPDATDGFEMFTTDILNVGVKPSELIKLVKEKYLAVGGTILEDTEISRLDLYNDAAVVTGRKLEKSSSSTESTDITISSRLIIDAMGNASPIAKQIRGPVEPDGICIVVGSCARGFDPLKNTYGDVIYTNSEIVKRETIPSSSAQKSSSQLQYFWEAFPAGSDPRDRTTYLFTYIDAKPERPSVSEVCGDH